MKPVFLACGLCTLVAAASASTLLASSEDETSFVLEVSTPPLSRLGTRQRTDASAPAYALEDDNDDSQKKRRFCKFRFEDAALEYDLCPLFEQKGKNERRPWNRWIWWKRETPPTVTSTAYVMSIRGPLQRNESRPLEEQCPEGTWICMTTWNYAEKKKEPYRVTQVVPVAGNLPLADNHTREHHPGLNATVKLGRKHNGASDPDLMITLRGGMYVGKNQSAALYYHCNASAQEPTSPEYGWQYNGYHVLHWHTPHACPRSLAAVPNPKPNPAPEPSPNEPDPTPETPPDDIPADAGGGGEPEDDDDQEFLVPPVPIETRRRFSIMAILAVLTLSGGAVYVLYTRSERVRALVPTSLPFHISVPTLKSPILPSFSSLPSPSKFRQSRRRWRRKGHKGFRPPESRLREWATEEGVLDDNYERGLLADSEYDLGGEEDFMVNARGGSDLLFDGDETDEEMPLTPSPRQFKPGGAKNYGTVG